MTDEQLRELRVEIKREALLEYAALVESNPSSEYWAKDDFVFDIREWAKDLEYWEQFKE